MHASIYIFAVKERVFEKYFYNNITIDKLNLILILTCKIHLLFSSNVKLESEGEI